jgi:hypothetical protein
VFGFQPAEAAGKFVNAFLGVDGADDEPDNKSDGDCENQQNDQWQGVHNCSFRVYRF